MAPVLDRKFDLEHAAVISHTGSGYNRKHGVAALDELAQAAGVLHLVVSSTQELEKTLYECAQQNLSLLVLNTGDGNVCAVIELMRERAKFAQEPALALLQGGTTNMIHKDVGLTGPPTTGLASLLRALRSGDYVSLNRPPLCVHRSQQTPLYGFFFATNAVVRAILRTRRSLHPHGMTGSVSEAVAIAAMIMKLMWYRAKADPALAPANVELRVNGGDWQPQQQILLLALTLQHLILKLRPLRPPHRSAWASLQWPDYQLGSWIRQFLRGNLPAFDSLELRGAFSWALDGEIFDHQIQDGTLQIKLGEPVEFLVAEAAR